MNQKGSAWDPFFLRVISCSENEKTTWGGGFSKVQQVVELLNRGNSLVRDVSPNLSFQCSLSKATTSRTLDTSLAHPAYQWLPPMAICRVFPGWTQVDSYRNGRGSRTERGVRAYSPAWSELPTRNWVSGVEWDKRGHNSGMTPVNRKAGTGERTRELPGGNAWDLYSPVGFRRHWFERQILWCLSGGRSLWKNGFAAASSLPC